MAFDRSTRSPPLKPKLSHVATTIPDGRITPLHSSLYFLDFVSADGKRLPVENKISVWDLSDGLVKIEPGGGLNQPEEFCHLTSVRIKYEGKDV